LPSDSDDDDEQEEYKGVVKNVQISDDKHCIVTLKDCKTAGGKSIPGVTIFGNELISDLKVLKEGDGKVESVVVPSKTSISQTNGHSTSNHSSKPMGRSRLYRNDNQHLKKLMPVQVTKKT
jgi:hypothetical protein